MRLNRWTILDLHLAQIDVRCLFILVELAKSVRREQDKSPRQPGRRIRYGVANDPDVVVKVKVLDVADVAIQGGEFVAVQIVGVL